MQIKSLNHTTNESLPPAPVGTFLENLDESNRRNEIEHNLTIFVIILLLLIFSIYFQVLSAFHRILSVIRVIWSRDNL